VVDQSSSAIISAVPPPEARNDLSTGCWPAAASPDITTAFGFHTYD
jgi:hypothetical protein